MEEHKSYKLLLVDDDQFLLNMYSLKFKKGGFDVTTVSSAQDALTKLKDGLNPDIIILDIIMPGMDGLQLLEAIRNDKLAESAVVIMLTNQGDEVERAKALGVKGYIVKATTVPSEVVTEVERIAKENGK